MSGTINPVEILRAALMERDPRILVDLGQPLSTWEGMVKVREQIRGLTVEPGDYEVVWSSIWHSDPVIAKRARTVVVLPKDAA